MSHSHDNDTGAQTLRSYVHGLTSSLILTLTAYFLVVYRLLSGWALVIALVVLGLIQAAAQFIFFLHLAQETKPRWNLMVFLFMAMVVLILVLGSVWIMYNLNSRVMDM